MIIALEDAKYKLIGMRADLKELGSALRIDELRREAEELDAQTLDPDFWSNQENSSKVLQRVKQTKDTIESYENLCNRLEDAITLAEMAIEENDEAYVEEVQSELDAIAKEEEEKRIEILLSGDHKKIERWRLERAVEVTRERRPDLLLLHPEFEEALKPREKKSKRRKPKETKE